MEESVPGNHASVRAYIDKIHRDYEVWYARICRINYRIWYALQLIALLSGFITSIFVAFQSKEEWSPAVKIICIVIPLLGSLAATIVLQFKIFETWKLREEGRIAFQNLVNYSNSELLKCKTTADYEKLYELITLKTNEIENDQANKFFSLYGSSFIASYGNK